MSKPGPKPKPKAIKIFEGNPGKRALNHNEPLPGEVIDDRPPEWLVVQSESEALEKTPVADLAEAIWNHFFNELVRIGTLKDIDKLMFTRYCHYFAQWLKLKGFLDKHGTTYPVYEVVDAWDEEQERVLPKKILKKIQAFPQFQQYKDLAAMMGRCEAEFGIGAASRTRIQTIVENTIKQGGNSLPGASNPFDYAASEEKVKGEGYDA